MRKALLSVALIAAAAGGESTASPRPAEGECDVTVFGAVGNNATHDTMAVAAAIAHCRKAFPDGAIVRFPAPGKYLIGQTNVTSNMTLYVENGATIVGSPRKQDYPRGVPVYGKDPEYKPLLYSEDTVNVKILGSNGTISGNGWAGGWYHDRWNLSGWQKGPMLIGMHRVHGLEIGNVTLRDGARWHIHPVWSTDVRVHDIHVFAPKHHGGHPLGGNDGIDPDSCRNVEISNVYIDTGDDAISVRRLTYDPYNPPPIPVSLLRYAVVIYVPCVPYRKGLVFRLSPSARIHAQTCASGMPLSSLVILPSVRTRLAASAISYLRIVGLATMRGALLGRSSSRCKAQAQSRTSPSAALRSAASWKRATTTEAVASHCRCQAMACGIFRSPMWLRRAWSRRAR